MVDLAAGRKAERIFFVWQFGRMYILCRFQYCPSGGVKRPVLLSSIRDAGLQVVAKALAILNIRGEDPVVVQALYANEVLIIKRPLNPGTTRQFPVTHAAAIARSKCRKLFFMLQK